MGSRLRGNDGMGLRVRVTDTLHGPHTGMTLLRANDITLDGC